MWLVKQNAQLWKKNKFLDFWSLSEIKITRKYINISNQLCIFWIPWASLSKELTGYSMAGPLISLTRNHALRYLGLMKGNTSKRPDMNREFNYTEEQHWCACSLQRIGRATRYHAWRGMKISKRTWTDVPICARRTFSLPAAHLNHHRDAKWSKSAIFRDNSAVFQLLETPPASGHSHRPWPTVIALNTLRIVPT